MKKTILAAAVAAAVMAAPMTAAANVVIYGKIHASLDYVSQDDYIGVVDRECKTKDIPCTVFGDDIYGNIDGSNNWEVTSRTTRIGFKGSEDLGNGLKAIWKIEVGYGLDGSNGNDSDTDGWGPGRNSYIGLAGDWGTFLVGKHDTPLKISTGRLDVFADTMADYNTTLGFVDRRAPNVMAYISPNWNGFTFAVAGVASEEYGDNLVGDGGYSLAAMYFNNGFYASAAYEDVSDLGYGDSGHDFATGGFTEWDAVDKNQIARIGLGYIMNAFTIGFVYEWQQLDEFDINSPIGDTVENEIDKWMISGAYDFGNNTIKAMFGQYKYDREFIDDEHKYASYSDTFDAWSIGIDHKLSVRTKVYALYADSDAGLHNHKETTYGGGNGFSMGMVHTF